MFKPDNSSWFIDYLKIFGDITESIWRQYLDTNPSDKEIASLIDIIKDDIHTYLEPGTLRNLLMFFIISGKNSWVDILFGKLTSEHAIRLLHLEDFRGQSALHYAAGNGRDNIELVKKLVILDDGNILFKEESSLSFAGCNVALYSAFIAGNKKVYKFLLSLGLPPIPKQVYYSFEFKHRLELDHLEPPTDLKLSPFEIKANIRKCKKSLEENYILNTSPSKSTFGHYVDLLSSCPTEISARITSIATFFNDLYRIWDTLYGREQDELKSSIAKFYKMISLQILDENESSQDLILSFLRLAEKIPDVFPSINEEKLVYWVLKYSALHTDSLSFAYLKKIEDKDDVIKFILFYNYCSDKNNEYNPELAIEYGHQCLISSNLSVTAHPCFGDFFNDVFALLKRERLAEQAFVLAESLKDDSKEGYSDQKIDKLFRLIYFAAEQYYQPAIDELIKVSLNTRYGYKGKFHFRLLADKQVEQIAELLKKLGQTPVTDKHSQSESHFEKSPSQPSITQLPVYPPLMFTLQKKNYSSANEYQYIIDQFISLGLLPEPLKSDVRISNYDFTDETLIIFDGKISFQDIEMIMSNLEAKGLRCDFYKALTYNAIAIFLKINELENWLGEFEFKKLVDQKY
jgi:hypothetical protein